MTDQNQKLLQDLYDHARMGGFTLQVILEKLKDVEFSRELTQELSDYRKDEQEVSARLRALGTEPEGLTGFEKKRTEWMTKWEMLQDDRSSHIAEMLILGSNMAIIQAIRDLNECQQAEESNRKLAKKMLQKEEANVQTWKSYL